MAAHTNILGGGNSIKFNDCLEKLLKVNAMKPQANKERVLSLINEMNSFNFKKTPTENHEAVDKGIKHLMNLVHTSDLSIAAKVCQLLSRLLRHQTLKIALPSESLSLYLEWCMEVFGEVGETALLESMAAIEIIIRGRAKSVSPQVLTALLSDHGKYSVVAWFKSKNLEALNQVSTSDVVLAALKVLKAIATPSELCNQDGISGNITPARARKLDTCAAIFQNHLTELSNDDVMYLKIVSVCLRGLQAVLLQRPTAVSLQWGLGLAKAFWLIGLPEYDLNSYPPIAAHPGSPPPSAAPTQGKSSPRLNMKGQPRGGGAKHMKRLKAALAKDDGDEGGGGADCFQAPRREEGPNSSCWWPLTSDSEEPSDSEGGVTTKEQQAGHAAVRFSALRLLLLVIKSGEQQALMAYWDSLVPFTSPNLPPSPSPSLLCCLLRDPSVYNRVAASHCIGELMLRCQPFLALAESSNATLPFTPWSHLLAQSLSSCQRCLILALSSERVSQGMVAILGAIGSLAAVTPYHRLTTGLLTRLARCVRPQLLHKNPEVRSAALAVFGALVSSSAATHQLPELRQLLQRPQPSSLLGTLDAKPRCEFEEEAEERVLIDDDDDDSSEVVGASGSLDKGYPWLVEYCLEALQVQEHNHRFRLEPCRVLALLARSHFWLLMHEGSSGSVVIIRVSLALAQSLTDSDLPVQLTAARALEELGLAMGNYLQQLGDAAEVGPAVVMWNGLLVSTVPYLAASSNATLRSLACDLLASIGPTVFEHLPHEKHMVLGFHLFALSRDASTNVCASAVRALGVCVAWPALREDGQFVLDATEYVSGALKSTNTVLRSKAASALGNLAEALVMSNEMGFPETIPGPLLVKMLESSLVACQDERLKAYALRALGNFLRLLSVIQLRQPEIKEILSQAVATLVQCAAGSSGSSMKVRWNACHSLACVMRGEALCEEGNSWQSTVFPMLCGLVNSSPNFKVRISASLALSSPTCRKHYGIHFLPTWEALLESLASADNVQDFKEFQHRDNLVDQICLSLCRLSALISSEDLSGGLSGMLSQLVLAHDDHLRDQMQRVRLRLVPEKALPFGKAHEHLHDISRKVTGGQQEVATYLASIFNNEDSELYEH